MGLIFSLVCQSCLTRMGRIIFGAKCIKAFVSCRLKGQKERYFSLDTLSTSEQCSGDEYYVINGQMYWTKHSFLLLSGTWPQN